MNAGKQALSPNALPLKVTSLTIDPDSLRPDVARARVTESVAAEFAKLADNLEHRGIEPQRSAHFLMRLLFCLFADSIGLLPDHLFRQMIELDRGANTCFRVVVRAAHAPLCVTLGSRCARPQDSRRSTA